jgi:hypothetical protein
MKVSKMSFLLIIVAIFPETNNILFIFFGI